MSSILEVVLKFFDGPHAGGDPEQFRRARLLTGFGILGAVFGTAYSAFYLSVGHYWGALVIILCSGCFALMPWLLRWGWGQPELAEAYSIILVIGFFALCWLEDGLHGHAIAWLASVPLCALLLIGLKGATRWGFICTGAAGVIAGLEFIGHSAPITYPAHLENLISTVGYLGLIVFMLLLGVIFERGREQAAKKMLAANEELSRANARLVQLNQEKNEFLSIAAHDLKNPLTVVRGMSDLLAMGILPPEKLKTTAEKISSQAVRMHDLIANLLDLNAIEEGRTNLRLEALDLGALTRQVGENFAGVAAQKQIRLNHVNGPTTAPAVGDRAATLQVLDNLVSNALKYSPKGGEVAVRVVPLADQVTVEVVDRGPGISAEDQAKLFQRFTKLTARPTAGESSNGLGLSIVKRLVEAMNGRISCRSELGQGTTFVFALPREVSINEVATPAPTKRAVPERRATSRGATVEWSASPSS